MDPHMRVIMPTAACEYVIAVSIIVTLLICASVTAAVSVDVDTLHVLAVMISVGALADLIGRDDTV
jgi:hypothetical protein